MSEETTRGHAPRGPLRRDRRSKVIAGVCGGLGRNLDIDPVVFRILFAVLSFVGGIGLLAYAAAWLFVPQEGADRSAAHRMLTGSNPLLAVLVAIGLGFGALASIRALTQGLTNVWPLWLIAAAVVGVLVWRGDLRLGGRVNSTIAPEQAPTWWQQPVGAPEGSATTGGGEPSSETASGSEAEAQGPQDAEPAWFAGTEGPQQPGPWVDLSNLGAGNQTRRVGEAAPEHSRRRAYGGLVMAILLAAAGVLGVLDAAGLVNLNWLSGGALVLLLLGAGMVVGGAFGKTTGLVPLGLVLAIPLITLSAAGVPLHGTISDETWMPASAAATQPEYKLAIGDGTLDLSNVAPGAGKTLEVSAQVGIGDLVVQVPADVNVTIHAHAGIGTVGEEGSNPPAVVGDYGTERSNGLGVTKNYTIPATGKAKGTLVLDIKVGIGDVNVEAGN